jgi:hypothetical protein
VERFGLSSPLSSRTSISAWIRVSIDMGLCSLNRQHGLVVGVVVVVKMGSMGWWSRNPIVGLVTVVGLAGTP